LLLEAIIDGLGTDEITLCDFALREGLVLDYITRNARHIQTIDRYPDVRRRSVIELGERCNYLAPHAQQVARLALAVFDGLKTRHRLGQQGARLARVRRPASRHRHARQLRAPP
jgi:exopolyphosphatase/guanosine-5'-triphosphate,3'-diphosphate pyrophosphatase